MSQLPTKLKKSVYFFSLVLFFCLFYSLALAALPTVGTITPSSGSTTPDTAKTFTCAYSDLDGWSNIKDAYLLINLNSTAFTNTAYLYYNQNTNLLYLRDDGNSAWLGGYAPGSANVIENSSVKLNCAATTVSGLTNSLKVSFNITFKPAYSGKTYNTYLKVVDDSSGVANWRRKGTFSINRAPQIGTILPVSGTGQANISTVFTTTYSDPDGWQNIQYVYLLINTSASGASCFYGYYNQNTNKLYLRNDANTAWLGGYSPGSSNIIENSYAKLDCANTTVSGTGTTITVNWSVILKSGFTGSKNTYLYVRDDLNSYVGYTKAGTWTMPNQIPAIGTITPSSGASQSGQAVNFNAVYFDADGWLNIQYVYFLANTSTAGANCLYAYYNQNTNKIYLRNDANTAWLGGFIPGSANVIENTYSKIDCSQTTVSGSDANLAVNWNITFKSAFIGTKKTYCYVRDDANAYKTWTQVGSWNIQSDATPPTGTISINNNANYINSTAVSLTLSAQDEAGGSGVSQMQFSNDNATWAAPEAFALSRSWDLGPGDGMKTVYVKFKDIAGNWSQVYSDTITLDTTPPELNITSPLDNAVIRP